MSKNGYHVTPKDDNWQVKKNGSKKASALTSTKKEAIDEGVRFAKSAKTELTIHDKKGKIQTKRSYGNDPCPPKDKK